MPPRCSQTAPRHPPDALQMSPQDSPSEGWILGADDDDDAGFMSACMPIAVVAACMSVAPMMKYSRYELAARRVLSCILAHWRVMKCAWA